MVVALSAVDAAVGHKTALTLITTHNRKRSHQYHRSRIHKSTFRRHPDPRRSSPPHIRSQHRQQEHQSRRVRKIAFLASAPSPCGVRRPSLGDQVFPEPICFDLGGFAGVVLMRDFNDNSDFCFETLFLRRSLVSTDQIRQYYLSSCLIGVHTSRDGQSQKRITNIKNRKVVKDPL